MPKTAFFIVIFSLFYPLLAESYPHSTEPYPQISSMERKDGLIAKSNQNANPIEYQSPFEIEPTALVNGCVNAITGHFVCFETDYTLPGVEPLFAQRNYISANTHDKGPLGKGWSRNYFGQIDYYTEHEFKYPDRAKVYDDNACYEYGGHKKHYRLFQDTYETLVTNYSSGKICAGTNIFNNELDFDYVFFTRSTGEKLIYNHIKKKSWHLIKEDKLNGNFLKFSYQGKQLKSVDAYGEKKSSDEAQTLIGRLEYEYGEQDKRPYILIKNRGVERACYRMDKFKGKSVDYAYYLVSAELQQNPSTTYEYETKKEHAKIPKMIRKNMPDGRFLAIDYYKRGSNDIGNDHHYQAHGRKSPWIGRVKHLRSPAGIGNAPIITHRFLYEDLEEKSGYTTVLDVYDRATRYIWNEEKRLSTIVKYTGTKHPQVYSIDTFDWGGNDFTETTYLKSRQFKDSDGKILFKRNFQYDAYGNILKDLLYGNLSGHSSTQEDLHIKNYTYKNKNLVETVSENGVKTIFEYVDNKNLIQAKFYETHGKIFKREFYTYDHNASVIQEIEDDGSSRDRDNLEDVTQRRIRDIAVTLEVPVGLPTHVIDSYHDIHTDEIKHIKTTVNSYCPDGHIISKTIYDRDHQLACTMTWEYDDHGNVLRETNALGQESTYRYDSNDNKIYEQGPDKRFYKQFHYDLMNRLIKAEEIYEDGLTLCETYAYNYLSQKISSTDIYGNQTAYFYDDLGRQVKTRQPAIPNETGDLNSPENEVVYNHFNTPKSSIDFNGNETTSECTIRGKPYKISHPDGTQEEYVYNLDGTVKKHIHKNGMITKFEYDHLQRIVSKTIKNQDKEILQSHTYVYSTFQLLEEKDATGQITKYRYDAAGRLVETIKGKNRITYEYDSLDHQYKTTEHNGEGNNISYIQLFDLMDRVIEERQEDSEGNVLTQVNYAHDEAGNRTKVTTYNDLGAASTITQYDARHLPVEIIDPLGNKTHIQHAYHYKNDYGQTVPYSESTDAMGNNTIHIKDTHGRLACLILKNCMGELLHQKNLFYDLNGKKSRQEDYATKGAGQRNKEAVVTTWTYDCMNRLTMVTEAKGSPEQKQTELRYNPQGENSELIKPNGVHIHKEYDPLSRLKRLHASDGSIDDTYHYDTNGNLVKISDAIHKLDTFKAYDEMNRLIEESLGNNLSISYVYDDLNNPCQLVLPDQSLIEYAYNGKRLKEVIRKSKDNACLYSHKYLNYDLQNKLTQAQLVGNAGNAVYAYDLSGRPLKIGHRLRNETISLYDKVGNILEKVVAEPKQKVHCVYTYDDLYQLSKESGVSEHTYVFDSLNNRILKNGLEHNHNQLNQLLSDSKTKYSYDANGNLTKKTSENQTTYFKYDALDRLIGVKIGHLSYQYLYDAQNRRIAKYCYDNEKLENVFRYLYAGQNELGCYSKDDKKLELRVLGLSNGAEIGAAVAIELGENVYAPLHDHIGNVTGLIDQETGHLIESYHYSAFGEETIFNEMGKQIPLSINPWRFSSKRYDPETGLIYFGRRYYDPTIGRWITSDPLGQADGPNFYAFVHNRPLNAFDPYGLWTIGTYSFGSHFADYGRWITNHVAYGIKYTGKFIDGIALHLVPIPVVREVLQLTGRMISGDGLQGFHMTGCGENMYGHLGQEEPKGPNGVEHRIFLIGGICTSVEEMRMRAETWSKSHGGCNVYYYASASDGLLLDLGKASVRALGISLPGDQNFKDVQDNLIDDVGEKGVVISGVHSQGGMILDNYRMDTTNNKGISRQAKQIYAFSFGSGRMLDTNHYCGAENYVSMRDIVPFIANPKPSFSALVSPRSDIIFLDSKGLPFLDHGWHCDVYQKKMTDINETIRSILTREK